MRKKRVLVIVMVLLAAGAWYGYNEYNRKNPDLADRKAETSATAVDLIASFSNDTASASRQYTDKVIAVTGVVKQVEAEDVPVVIFLGDAAQMSSVQCSMDSTHASAYKDIAEGSTVTIKGICNGYQWDELLGTDVKLGRAVIEKKQ